MLPEAHTVEVKLSAERVTEAAAGECTLELPPRRRGKGESAKQPCKNTFVIKRVPYSPDAKVSGGEVKVKLPDGREIAETDRRRRTCWSSRWATRSCRARAIRTGR